MNQFYRNIVYLSDVTGTGFWRHIMPITTANCIQHQTRIVNSYTQQPVLDPKFYNGMNAVFIQRWMIPQQLEIVEKFMKPVFAQTGTKLIYECDDLTDANHIPLYNTGRKGFDNKEVQDSIKKMMGYSDIVLVTTQYLKEQVSKSYSIPKDKIIAVPNLLPRWWFGDRYDPRKKVEQFQHYKSKPRIGVISSLSHFNLAKLKDENGELIKDDFNEILELVLSTIDDFQWVFIGWIPDELKPFAEQKKILVYPMSPIVSYPSMIENIQLQAVVAPLIDNVFNRCKSPIKFLECAASGVPLFAPDMLPYSPVMPKDYLYHSQDELKDKLLKLKFSSTGAYQKAIDANWKWLNAPKTDGDFKVQNSWMEDNIGVWLSLYAIENEKGPQLKEVK